MKKLFFIGACLLALGSTPVLAQTGGTEVVVVKVVEGYYSITFDIARPDGKQEHREYRTKDLNKLNEKNVGGAAAEVTRQLFTELAQQGYTLTTTYDAAPNGPITLIFTKKQ